MAPTATRQIEFEGRPSPATGNRRRFKPRLVGAPEPVASVASGRTVGLFGLNIHDTYLADAATWIVERATSRAPTQVAFVNAHCINVMCRDSAYRAALEGCDRIFADGSGMALAARAAGIQLRDNVNGTDLFPVLCRAASMQGANLYLFGGMPGVADSAAARMLVEVPDLDIAGTSHGFMRRRGDEERAIERINASGAQIVLVGLGVPAQELWIARNRHRLDAPVVIGVGGLFDYYSDRIPRAPRIVRAVGCEWAWRLAQEPRRLARRYLLGNVEFLMRVARLRLLAPQTLAQPVAAPALLVAE